jgi:peroxiredoxin
MLVAIFFCTTFLGCKTTGNATIPAHEMLFPNYAGKVLIVEVGLVESCVLSHKFLHELENMYGKLKEMNADVLRVDVIASEQEQKKYYEKNPVSFAQMSDTDGKLARKLMVRLLPTIIVIDKFGYMRFSGRLERDNMFELVKKLSSEVSPPSDLEPADKLKTGSLAPSFEAVGLNGNTFSVEDNVKNHKITALLFHSTICPYSAKAIGQFCDVIDMCRDNSNIQFGIIFLENEAAIMSSQILDNPRVSAVVQGGKKIFDLYRVEGAPFIVLIDEQQKLLYYGYFESREPFDLMFGKAGGAENLLVKTPGMSMTGLSETKVSISDLLNSSSALLIGVQKAEDTLLVENIEEFAGFGEFMKSQNVAGLLIDVSADKDVATTYYNENKFPFEVILDSQNEIFSKMTRMDAPYYILIGKNRSVIYTGNFNEEKLNYYLDLIKAGKPILPYIDAAPAWG